MGINPLAITPKRRNNRRGRYLFPDDQKDQSYLSFSNREYNRFDSQKCSKSYIFEKNYVLYLNKIEKFLNHKIKYSKAKRKITKGNSKSKIKQEDEKVEELPIVINTSEFDVDKCIEGHNNRLLEQRQKRKQSKRLINDNTESVLNFKHLSEAFSQTSFDILRTSRKIKERNEIVNMRKCIMSNDRIVTKLPRFCTPLAKKLMNENTNEEKQRLMDLSKAIRNKTFRTNIFPIQNSDHQEFSESFDINQELNAKLKIMKSFDNRNLVNKYLKITPRESKQQSDLFNNDSTAKISERRISLNEKFKIYGVRSSKQLKSLASLSTSNLKSK